MQKTILIKAVLLQVLQEVHDELYDNNDYDAIEMIYVNHYNSVIDLILTVQTTACRDCDDVAIAMLLNRCNNIIYHYSCNYHNTSQIGKAEKNANVDYYTKLIVKIRTLINEN